MQKTHYLILRLEQRGACGGQWVAGTSGERGQATFGVSRPWTRPVVLNLGAGTHLWVARSYGIHIFYVV